VRISPNLQRHCSWGWR